MENQIKQTVEFVKSTLDGAESGHDWFHIERVYKMACTINKKEKGDVQIISLAALLHDIADSKFHDGDEEIGPQKAREFLLAIGVSIEVVEAVTSIIRNMSFKKSFEGDVVRSKELDIVQDADRLDAIGAIGIARTFNYGGYKNRAMYDPAIKPEMNHTKESYKNSTAPTINHFYEKLLLLKDQMNTETARRLAEQRHQFMEQFLAQFYAEWEGKR